MSKVHMDRQTKICSKWPHLCTTCSNVA